MQFNAGKRPSFGWNIKTHKYITRKALENNEVLSKDEANRVALYSQEPDLIHSEMVDMGSGHFYDVLHEDPSFGIINDDKNNALSRFIKHNGNALNAVSAQDREKFLKAIAYAAHYMQDASTPPHIEHGNYLHKLYRLPMHYMFERASKTGASSRLDILEKEYVPEEIPFSSLESLLHNSALFAVQPENHVSYHNMKDWPEIQHRCVDRGINSTIAYFNYILQFLPQK